MTRREQRTVSLALLILRHAAKAFGPTARGEGVQLALRVLLAWADRSDLTLFWTIADNPNPSQRAHQLGRVLSVIEAGVERALNEVLG